MAFSPVFFIISIFLTLISIIPPSDADPRTDIVARVCGDYKVENTSDYFSEYSTVIEHVKEDMGRNKFAIRESGNLPNKMYVMSQCMDDLTNKECEMCFGHGINLLTGCFPATSGRVYLDGCFVRLDNYSFYSEDTGPHDMARCGDDSEPKHIYEELVKKVIEKIAEKAPEEKGFTTQEQTANGLSAYGMGACWRTLSYDKCSRCLNKAANNVAVCLPKMEGRAIDSGCYLRYSCYKFANEPLEEKPDILKYVLWTLGAVIGCALATIIGFLLGKVTYKKKNSRTVPQEMEVDLSELHGSLHFLQFKHSTLEKATKCFSEDNKLGHGGYGEVYKGTLADGREIAIKRLFMSRKNRIKEICNEMDIISKAQHKNLVHFLGCCFTNADSFLVYEYLPHRSLDLMLFDSEKKKELDWKKRLGIITGTAEGLEYLHNECDVRIIHRDIKASNILLDLKHRPKIADFGLARFYSSEKTFVSTAIAGTLGYMAPEYIGKGRLTEKVDVYSFGVLVLEIVSAMQNHKFQSDNYFETLVTQTWKHFQANTVTQIIDKSLEIGDIEEIKRVIRIGLLCTQESPVLRPSMTNVVQMLKQKDFKLATPTRPPFAEEYMDISPSSSDGLKASLVPSTLENISPKYGNKCE